MQDFINFVIQYWQIIAFILIFVAIIPITFIVQGKWKELRMYSYKLILAAEKIITGEKAGKERFDYVLSCLYDYLVPNYLRVFITKPMVARQLQIWFYDVKDYLDDGKVNKSVSGEEQL